MSQTIEKYIEFVMHWWHTTDDRSDESFRKALAGFPPANSSKSWTQSIPTRDSIIIHEFDPEMVRYRLRKVFAEQARFRTKDIRKLAQEHNVEDKVARMMFYGYQAYLCDIFEEEGYLNFREKTYEILSNAINDIHEKSIGDSLNRFWDKAKSQKDELKGFDFQTSSEIIGNAHRMINKWNKGRKKDKSDKYEQIVVGMVKFLKNWFDSKEPSDQKEIRAGDIPFPKITIEAAAPDIESNRVTIGRWIKRSKIPRKSYIDDAETRFSKSIKKQ